MPAATFESVYQSANLKRDTSSRPHGSQFDGSTPKKPKVDIDEVKDFVQVFYSCLCSSVLLCFLPNS